MFVSLRVVSWFSFVFNISNDLTLVHEWLLMVAEN